VSVHRPATNSVHFKQGKQRSYTVHGSRTRQIENSSKVDYSRETSSTDHGLSLSTGWTGRCLDDAPQERRTTVTVDAVRFLDYGRWGPAERRVIENQISYGRLGYLSTTSVSWSHSRTITDIVIRFI